MAHVIGAEQLPNGRWKGWWRWDCSNGTRRTCLGEWETEADALDVARYAAEDSEKPQDRLVKPPTLNQTLRPWIKEAARLRREAAKTDEQGSK